jgi:hypothetical protein
MAVAQTMPETPQKQDATEGTFALCLSGDKYRLYQYDTKSPLRSTPDWREVDAFSRQTAPPLTLESAEFHEEDGNLWAYAKELEAEYEIENEGTDSDSTTQKQVGKYIVNFDDGQTVSGNTQAQAMAEAVDLLIRKYNLFDIIDLPYMSGHKNALLSHREKHPDGREMKLSKELTGGHYISTEMDGKQKRKHIEDLAHECGNDVEFNDGWA